MRDMIRCHIVNTETVAADCTCHRQAGALPTSGITACPRVGVLYFSQCYAQLLLNLCKTPRSHGNHTDKLCRKMLLRGKLPAQMSAGGDRGIGMQGPRVQGYVIVLGAVPVHHGPGRPLIEVDLIGKVAVVEPAQVLRTPPRPGQEQRHAMHERQQCATAVAVSTPQAHKFRPGSCMRSAYSCRAQLQPGQPCPQGR